MREATVSVHDSEFDAIGIEELVSLSRNAGIVTFEELACHGTGAIVQVEVETRYDEQRLTALRCVDEWEHVSATDSGHLYIIAFSASELPESLAETADELIGTCDPTLDDETVSMSLVGPQNAIAETIHEYESVGASPDLRKLGSYSGGEKPTDELTDKQLEVIQTAMEMGYYEVPKEASTNQIAAELALDGSTVAEHLQRAERNVLRQVLE